MLSLRVLLVVLSLHDEWWEWLPAGHGLERKLLLSCVLQSLETAGSGAAGSLGAWWLLLTRLWLAQASCTEQFTCDGELDAMSDQQGGRKRGHCVILKLILSFEFWKSDGVYLLTESSTLESPCISNSSSKNISGQFTNTQRPATPHRK